MSIGSDRMNISAESSNLAGLGEKAPTTSGVAFHGTAVFPDAQYPNPRGVGGWEDSAQETGNVVAARIIEDNVNI